MPLTDIATMRLGSQQISATGLTSVKEMVGWMGAMQAQDLPMAKWAIGSRLPESTDRTIEAAINRGEIIRTHALRPTWHLVSADDIYWILELTSPHIKASLRPRHKALEVTEAAVARSQEVIEDALRGGVHLTREEIAARLEEAKIATHGNRIYHFLLRAEVEGILCSGEIKESKQTYALLEERVPRPAPLSREEALAKLARVYFASHGPATLQDFVWWSGLSVTDAKRALEMAKPGLISETIASQTYWRSDSVSISRSGQESVFLLPAFDEFLIGYKDRSASLPFEDHARAVSSNGIFRPIIVENGKVIGIWRRAAKKDHVVVETEFFKPPGKAVKGLIEPEARRFGKFLGREAGIRLKS